MISYYSGCGCGIDIDDERIDDYCYKGPNGYELNGYCYHCSLESNLLFDNRGAVFSAGAGTNTSKVYIHSRTLPITGGPNSHATPIEGPSVRGQYWGLTEVR